MEEIDEEIKVSDTQIVAILKEGEKGRLVAEICREHGISNATYYQWKSKYGGMEGAALDRQLLRASVEKSGAAIRDLLLKGIASGGKVKGFKPHVVAYLGYLISHESHHRGQIVMTLKQAGYPVDRKIQFGLWEWGVR